MKKTTIFLTVITLLFVSLLSTGCNFDINEIFGNSDKITKLEQQIKDLEAERDAANARIADLESQLKEAENKAAEKDTKIAELEAQIKALKEEIARLKGGKVEDDLSVHFMMLGNKYAGDSVYIKAGDTDILIDAGSRTSSAAVIGEYINQYVTDNVLEYVIATHADQDHIAGFAGDKSNKSIFELYKCGTIIDFPRTDKSTATYNKYVANRDKEVAEDGAVHYSALECYNNENGAKREYELANGITLKILYNYFYENKSTDENNYSVCLMIEQGEKKFLFTGDLEEKGEEYLVRDNAEELTPVKLFKAGHHGSKTSSNEVLLEKIQPEICVVSCVCGTDEYTDAVANQFPTQAFIDRISKYTVKVFVTSMGDPDYTGGAAFVPMNGNVVVTSDSTGVNVNCSNNNTYLKDTAWFKAKRTCPSYWAA